MTLTELEKQIEQIREQPIIIVCLTPDGKQKAMSLRACIESKSAFLYIARDGLDKLLEDELPKIERGIAAERKGAIL